MIKQLRFLLLLICMANFGIAKAAALSIDTLLIKNSPLQFELPNDHWHLAVNDPPYKYIFKRDPITNADGRQIIPAIMFFAEDASRFKHDLVMFYASKIGNLSKIKIDSIINWQHKEYPLKFTDALYVKGNYVDQDVAHIVYMVYLIDKHNKGIQVYFDITKDIAPQYEHEFMKTIRSMQLLP